MIAEEIKKINSELNNNTTRLVAISKYHPAEAIMEAYNAGQRIFGESHVQELQKKHEILPKDIEWHFIGHLQTNKVKYIAPYISLIHSVDSTRLLEEINKQGERLGRQIPCLLELHIAQEDSKYGFSFDECEDFLSSGNWRNMPGVQLAGIMCMASQTNDKEQIAKEFESAYQFFVHARDTYFKEDKYFKECSWGMSNDYPIALTHGSTLIRVGTRIFGNRIY